MLRYLTICLVLVLSLSVMSSEGVQACSGGTPADRWSLDATLAVLNIPVLAVGRINSLSESSFNAVLQVDYYLKGTTEDKFLIFEYSNPRYIEVVMNGRPFPRNCDVVGFRLPAGRRFIAGLWRNDSGSYNGTVITENENGFFERRDPNNAEQTIFLTYEETLAYAVQSLNTILRTPQNSAMPRPATVQISTSSGNIYLLPVDQNMLHPTVSPYCAQYMLVPCTNHITAPNGMDSASFYPLSTEMIVADRPYAQAVQGETGVFSNASDLLTVWANGELQVYATMGQGGFGAPDMKNAHLLQTLAFDPADSLINNAGAWSPNGRTFAFSAASGVWLWDALTPDAEPTLFFPAQDEPVLVHHFSPAGNYLALETNSRRFNIDITSRQEYPDGLFSFDDRILAAYDTAAENLTPLRLYTVLPEFTPFYGWNNSDVEISQFEWVGNLEYVYAACGNPIYDPEIGTGFYQPWCKVFDIRFARNSAYRVDGIAFDYEPTTGSLATQIDGDTITINGEVIELGDQIDGSIIHIKLIPLIDLNYRNF